MPALLLLQKPACNSSRDGKRACPAEDPHCLHALYNNDKAANGDVVCAHAGAYPLPFLLLLQKPACNLQPEITLHECTIFRSATLARAYDALLLKLAPEQSLPLLQKHTQQKLAGCGASLSLAGGLLLSIEEVTDAPLTMWVDRTCGSVSPDMPLLRLHM